MAEILNNHRLDGAESPVNNGISTTNYQAQLVIRRISAIFTVYFFPLKGGESESLIGIRSAHRNEKNGFNGFNGTYKVGPYQLYMEL